MSEPRNVTNASTFDLSSRIVSLGDKSSASKTTGGNVAAATLVGKRVAEKAKAAGIESVAFDRSGFRYHGRVKALAEAAREAGLKF